MGAAAGLVAQFLQFFGLKRFRILVLGGGCQQAEVWIGSGAHMVAVFRLKSQAKDVSARLDALLLIVRPGLGKANGADDGAFGNFAVGKAVLDLVGRRFGRELLGEP